ncbi:MAG TPA: cbb3-type cytochrome c oxidase subunit II [Opitutaceae bacterium]|nr:cbb3-type cytochrome c oxidase subunit II [Opitutaceae bacterium]
MRNGPLFLLGLFAALTLSWAGIVLGSNAQLGSLAPYYDDAEGQSFPLRAPGIANRGQLVYADLGCAACHTQQVRRPDFGSDQARGWGDRQSVARDYIFQSRPQLGASRFGPDLTNLAGRKPSAPDADDLMNLLYAGSERHPAYKFLFTERAIAGEPASIALKLTGNAAPDAGREVIPTERAQSLVAYLLSLNNGYDYPEARPIVNPEAEKKPAPAAAPATEKKENAPAATPAPAAQKAEGKK